VISAGIQDNGEVCYEGPGRAVIFQRGDELSMDKFYAPFIQAHYTVFCI
jgi:hypothetical protein